MDRSTYLLALLLLLSCACSFSHARKMVLFGHSDGPEKNWIAVRILDFHHAHKQFLRHERPHSMLKGKIPWFQTSRRLPFDQTAGAGVSPSFVCNTCMDISTFAEQVLADPETINDVLDYINGSVCEVLPGLKEQCFSIAETYVPEVIEVLQVYAAPNKLCGETKLCPSSSMLLLDDATTCKVCTLFANKALGFLNNNQTESEILSALELECSKLGILSSKCESLVSTYIPRYIDELESTSPEAVCEKVGMCTAASFGDANHCAACEFAVFELKTKLRSPAVQEKMLDMLLESCSKVQNHVNECKEIVTLYAPLVLANIDSFVDADTICTKIHACDFTPKAGTDSPDLLIRLPSSKQ